PGGDRPGYHCLRASQSANKVDRRGSTDHQGSDYLIPHSLELRLRGASTGVAQTHFLSVQIVRIRSRATISHVPITSPFSTTYACLCMAQVGQMWVGMASTSSPGLKRSASRVSITSCSS